MLKMLPAMSLTHANVGGIDTNQYHVDLGPEYTFEDVFRTSFWTHHKARLLNRDRIRVRAEDGSFDIEVTVTKTEQGEVAVELWPKYPKHMSAARIQEISDTGAETAALKPSLVPLSKLDGEPLARVEFREATKWRVMGHDGHEISRDHKSRTDADKILAKYLKEMNLTLPSDDAIAEAKKAIADANALRLEREKAKVKA